MIPRAAAGALVLLGLLTASRSSRNSGVTAFNSGMPQLNGVTPELRVVRSSPSLIQVFSLESWSESISPMPS
jgi:hypothetical protein